MKIKKIYVYPEFRRRGIASLLVRKVIEKAMEKGCHKIFAITRAANSTANKFFEHLGFQKEGLLRKHYFGIDYVQWAKSL